MKEYEMSKEYKGYLIDLDGTMYIGNEPIKEAGGFIKRLRETELPFLFVTNNSTNHPAVVAKKLESLNVEAYEEEIYTSSLATTDFLKTLEGNSVFVIGEEGLKGSIEEAGFENNSKNPDHVVVGLDRNATYDDFEKATLAIRNGANFIATNKDTNLPTEKGLIPGTGALVALIEKATRKTPIFVGKPKSIIMNESIKHIGLNKEDVLMVGDNYETDILAGINNDIDTLLVLTGFTSESELTTFDKQPTFVIDNLDHWSF